MKKISPRQSRIKLPKAGDEEKVWQTRGTGKRPQLDPGRPRKASADSLLTGETLGAAPPGLRSQARVSPLTTSQWKSSWARRQENRSRSVQPERGHPCQGRKLRRTDTRTQNGTRASNKVAGHTVNMRKSAAVLYTSNEQRAFGVKNAVPFTRAPHSEPRFRPRRTHRTTRLEARRTPRQHTAAKSVHVASWQAGPPNPSGH